MKTGKKRTAGVAKATGSSDGGSETANSDFSALTADYFLRGPIL